MTIVESIAEIPWDVLTLSLQIVAKVRIQQNCANFISWNAEKQIEPCESTAKEVSLK